MRGGRTKLAHLTAPQANYQHEEKGDALHAMELALSLEKLNFHKLRELHDIADASHDAQMADFVEDMLAEQVCDMARESCCKMCFTDGLMGLQAEWHGNPASAVQHKLSWFSQYLTFLNAAFASLCAALI